MSKKTKIAGSARLPRVENGRILTSMAHRIGRIAAGHRDGRRVVRCSKNPGENSENALPGDRRCTVDDPRSEYKASPVACKRILGVRSVAGTVRDKSYGAFADPFVALR
ncbi:hypothetical protein [Lysobacter hankyongensis]|uniref:Uncharacterized protein n=1 Tax=Lysobacter hankyongensis TaxID=1176535 RepID=A0ABP9BJV3_9GAMM